MISENFKVYIIKLENFCLVFFGKTVGKNNTSKLRSHLCLNKLTQLVFQALKTRKHFSTASKSFSKPFSTASFLRI